MTKQEQKELNKIINNLLPFKHLGDYLKEIAHNVCVYDPGVVDISIRFSKRSYTIPNMSYI